MRKKSHPEPHIPNMNAKLSWLRAAVLGANDGIVSIAGLVVGVAGATQETHIIATAGIAGIIAGAISMAAGEYISVSTARDTEKALLLKEKIELETYPNEELQELIELYEKKGLSRNTATTVAKELTEKDAFAAHVDVELNIDPDNLTNPWQAAYASASAFTLGAIIPLIAILLPPPAFRIQMAFVSVFIALLITATVSATIGGSSKITSIIRVVSGGILAMIVTYGVGKLFGVSGV